MLTLTQQVKCNKQPQMAMFSKLKHSLHERKRGHVTLEANKESHAWESGDLEESQRPLPRHIERGGNWPLKRAQELWFPHVITHAGMGSSEMQLLLSHP